MSHPVIKARASSPASEQEESDFQFLEFAAAETENISLA